MIAPYYEQDGITIYHGDCRDVLEDLIGHWGDQPFDLLLTDPPYGIFERGGKWGKKAALRWDRDTCPELPAMLRMARDQIV